MAPLWLQFYWAIQELYYFFFSWHVMTFTLSHSVFLSISGSLSMPWTAVVAGLSQVMCQCALPVQSLMTAEQKVHLHFLFPSLHLSSSTPSRSIWEDCIFTPVTGVNEQWIRHRWPDGEMAGQGAMVWELHFLYDGIISSHGHEVEIKLQEKKVTQVFFGKLRILGFLNGFNLKPSLTGCKVLHNILRIPK